MAAKVVSSRSKSRSQFNLLCSVSPMLHTHLFVELGKVRTSQPAAAHLKWSQIYASNSRHMAGDQPKKNQANSHYTRLLWYHLESYIHRLAFLFSPLRCLSRHAVLLLVLASTSLSRTRFIFRFVVFETVPLETTISPAYSTTTTTTRLFANHQPTSHHPSIYPTHLMQPPARLAGARRAAAGLPGGHRALFPILLAVERPSGGHAVIMLCRLSAEIYHLVDTAYILALYSAIAKCWPLHLSNARKMCAVSKIASKHEGMQLQPGLRL